jgi:glycolate oxidase FAD binding subunit
VDLSAEEAVRAAVAAAATVVPVGSGTHTEVGGPVPHGTPVRAPAGIVTYDPAELTVTAYAGTTVADLDGALGAHGQECVLDPRDRRATIGGVLAVGLSGHRRLRQGPLRDRVLEVRFVTGDARLVRGGGPTVKNVTGFDLPRLLVGSFGTLGCLTRVILRCQPAPRATAWWRTDEDPAAVRAHLVAPSTIAWSDADGTAVLLEGDPDDIAAQARTAALEAGDAPRWPDGAHRGRVSVAPGRLRDVARALDDLEGVTWLGEWGVGTVHVAADTEAGLGAARAAATACDGWMLREAGAPGLDGFGITLPNAEVTARVKAAFDPAGKLSPGRLPIPHPGLQREAS